MGEWRYTLCEPTFDAQEERAAVACIKSGWVSMGPETQNLEEEFAKMHGVEHAIACSSGTAALHLALLALDVGANPKDEVIQPSLSFVAASNMTRAVGARPAFVDIVDLSEPTLDPSHVEASISGKTKAVIAMHYGGYSARIEELSDICKRHNIALIEDACHAPVQSISNDQPQFLGTFGDIGCFSFFSNKNLTCGEGGMLVTRSDVLAARLRALRSHGMTTLSWERHKGRAATYDVTEAGFNYRIDDLRSSIARVQLRKLELSNQRRRTLASLYSNAIESINTDTIQYVFAHDIDRGTAHIASVLVAPEKRDEVRQGLAEQGIQTSMHYPPIHRFAAYVETSAVSLPKTERYAQCAISLPMHPGLPDSGTEEIVAACHKLLV